MVFSCDGSRKPPPQYQLDVRMKNKIIILLACLLPLPCFAAEDRPRRAINTELKTWCSSHIKAFNTADYEKLKPYYRFPCSVLVDDEVKIFTADGTPLVDFEKVKASGWAYSKIEKVKVLSASDSRAMVSMTFTRFDKSDEKLLTTTTYLGLTKVDEQWGVKTIFLADEIPLD